MQRQIISTADGSHTISIPEMNVTYHSTHGAIRESMHVFIEAGLSKINEAGKKELHIFEMGLGTGLNALLTLLEAEKNQQLIHYTALELFPLEQEAIQSLNYCDQLNRKDLQPFFEQLHTCDWEKEISISPHFILKKSRTDLLNFNPLDSQHWDLVYFDAFAPSAQPALWTQQVFEKLYNMLAPGGLLTTYCSKGDVRRAMQAARFKVEKIPGPPGKREMVRAMKIDS
jgi:tRNA U34 5-methylaminomethyl-2-thiouridine-forming methyltransferase MnmC